MQKRLLSSIFITLFFLSCKKDSDTAPKTGTLPVVKTTTCDLTRSNGMDGAFSSYEYDTNNRIKSIQHHLPAGSNAPESDYKYTFTRDSNNRIIEVAGGDVKDSFKNSDAYEYDAKGRWVKTTITTVPASNSYTTIIPEYNNQGLIVKISENRYSGSNVYPKVRTYEYKDGNLVSSRETRNDLVITSYYEYFLDKERKQSELDTLSSYNFSLGTPSKNLRKNIKTLNKGQLMETSYTYIVDGQGYVQKQTTKITIDRVSVGDSDVTFTYKCN